ncbi:unnamed protein product [Boreogadus saida]
MELGSVTSTSGSSEHGRGLCVLNRGDAPRSFLDNKPHPELQRRQGSWPGGTDEMAFDAVSSWHYAPELELVPGRCTVASQFS